MAGLGVRSLQHWLTWQAGISPGHAREVVRLAEARDTHPAIMSTFAAGAISMDQAAVATKVPAYLDGHIAQTVTFATVPQLRTMVRGARSAPPAPTDPELAPSESLAGWFDDDGRYHLRGDLDADHGRLVDAALSGARDALFRAGQTKVSWADALVEMAQRSLDGGAADERRERFRVNWFVDPADPIPARWSDGLAVPDVVARDAQLRRHGHPRLHRRCSAGVGGAHPAVRAGTDPAAGAGQGSQVSGAVVCPDPLAARPPPPPLRTTAAAPTPTTWPPCAPPTTASTIEGCSASPATPTTPTGSCSPTPPGG